MGRQAYRRGLALKYLGFFLILTAFSFASLGHAEPTLFAEINEMAQDDPATRHFLVLSNSEGPGLSLLRRGIVCRLTPQQAENLGAQLPTTTREHRSRTGAYTVLYVTNNLENQAVVKQLLGDRLGDPEVARTFREARLVPILTPVFVS